MSPRLLPALQAPWRFTLAFALVCVAFAGNAVFFGGNWPLATFLSTLVLALAALVGFPEVKLPPVIRYGIIVPILVVFVWALLQCIPSALLPAPLNLLMQTHPAFALVGNVPWAATAINPVAGLVQLAESMALAMAAITLFTLSTANPAAAARARLAVAIVGCLVAAYGLLVYLNGNHYVLWFPKTSYGGDLTATFINRNTFATFCGLAILACFAQFFERIGEISTRLTPRQRLRAFWLLVLRPQWGWLAASFVLSVALILTHSRAGVVATVLGVLVMLVGLLWARRSTRIIMGGFLLLGVIAGASTLTLIGADLGTRFSRLSADNQTREAIYELTEEAISQAPYTGHGLGGYAEAFRFIRSPESMKILAGSVDSAHNTYLELTAELGIPAATVLLAAIVATVLVLGRGLATRRRGVVLPATGLGALALVGTHGLVDFSLSIPAVTLATMLLVVPALAQSLSSSASKPVGVPTPQAVRITWGVVALFLAGVSAWLAWAAWPATKAGAVVTQVVASKEPLSLETLTHARHEFMQSARRNPTNARYWSSIAILDMARADQLRGKPAYMVLKASAAQSLNRALALNPADPASWFRLALVLDEPNNRRAALLNSILTGPFEPVLTKARLPLEEEVLRTAPAEDAELIRKHLEQVKQVATPKPQPQAKPLGGGSQTR